MMNYVPKSTPATYWCTHLAVFFAPWSGFAFFQKGLHLQISLAFTVLALGIDVPRMILRGHLRNLLRVSNLWALMFGFLWMVLSLFKIDPSETYAGRDGVELALRQFFSFLTGLCFYFLILLAASNWTEIKKLLRTYVLGFIPPLVFGGMEILNVLLNRSIEPILSALQTKNPVYNFSYLHGTQIPRLTLLTPEASFACVYSQSVFAIFIATILFKSKDKIISKYLGVSALIVSLMTFAKTIIFPVFLVALGLACLTIPKDHQRFYVLKKLRRGFLMLGVLSLLGVLGLLSYRLLNLVDGANLDDVSTWTRFYDLMVGVKMALLNPLFGVGWGGYSLEYYHYQVDWLKIAGNLELLGHLTDAGELGFLSPYNLMVHFSAEIGIVGAIIFSVFFFKGILRCLKLQSVDEEHASLALACALGFLATIGGTLTYVNFNIYYFWFFCALTHVSAGLLRNKSI